MTNSTEMLHAAFAYAAQEAKAHRRAGSTRTVDYLREILGIFLYQARQLLNLGNSLFAEPEEDREDDPGRVGAEENPECTSEAEDDERAHHSMNRDQRDGSEGLGYADVDPGTGRIGVVPSATRSTPSQQARGQQTREFAWMSPHGVELNRTFAAAKAPGVRIMRQKWSAREESCSENRNGEKHGH